AVERVGDGAAVGGGGRVRRLQRQLVPLRPAPRPGADVGRAGAAREVVGHQEVADVAVDRTGGGGRRLLVELEVHVGVAIAVSPHPSQVEVCGVVLDAGVDVG